MRRHFQTELWLWNVSRKFSKNFLYFHKNKNYEKKTMNETDVGTEHEILRFCESLNLHIRF